MALDLHDDLAREPRSSGLGAAFAALARGTTRTTVVVTCAADDPLPRLVEMALVAVAVEGVENAATHGEAPVVELDLRHEPGFVSLRVVDDGLGGARVVPGGGLERLSEQVVALGGQLTITSPAWAGTSLLVLLPL